jgi:glycosyltransferase involved in cell wall biosynthesis
MSKSLLTNFYERQFLIQRYKRINNHFITISKDTNAYFKRILPRSLKKNVLLLNNAINTRRFSNLNHERKRDKLRLLNVGSFREVKNQQFLVDVADELHKRGENFEMTLVGDGPTFAQVKEKVESKGLQEVVMMPANVINVEDYYRDANIYVHSTILESFGLVYLEAMSAGLPIVTLDAGGNRDLIIDGETGFMIQKQDAVEFAEKIIRLFNDDALYTKFACNGATFAKSYDIVPYTDRLIDLYRNA